MIRTIEAIIDERGNVKLLEPVPNSRLCDRAFVTILEEAPVVSVNETALLSEPALAKDWNRPEEEMAWSHLRHSGMLVPFPFSDLSQAKLRPAVVLADAGRGDWILCQITEQPLRRFACH